MIADIPKRDSVMDSVPTLIVLKKIFAVSILGNSQRLRNIFRRKGLVLHYFFECETSLFEKNSKSTLGPVFAQKKKISYCGLFLAKCRFRICRSIAELGEDSREFSFSSFVVVLLV